MGTKYDHLSWDDDGDDYRREVATVETPHGVFRAVVELDEYPEAPAPEDDFGCPVYRLNYRGDSRDGRLIGTYTRCMRCGNAP